MAKYLPQGFTASMWLIQAWTLVCLTLKPCWDYPESFTKNRWGAGLGKVPGVTWREQNVFLPFALWRGNQAGKGGAGSAVAGVGAEPECSPVFFCSIARNCVFWKEGEDSFPPGARERQWVRKNGWEDLGEQNAKWWRTLLKLDLKFPYASRYQIWGFF